MIIGLDADFWFCLSVGVLLYCLCVFSGFSESVMALCACSSPILLVYSQGIPAAIRGWVTGMTWGKEGWRRRSLWSTEDSIIEEREKTADFQQQIQGYRMILGVQRICWQFCSKAIAGALFWCSGQNWGFVSWGKKRKKVCGQSTCFLEGVVCGLAWEVSPGIVGSDTLTRGVGKVRKEWSVRPIGDVSRGE